MGKAAGRTGDQLGSLERERSCGRETIRLIGEIEEVGTRTGEKERTCAVSDVLLRLYGVRWSWQGESLMGEIKPSLMTSGRNGGEEEKKGLTRMGGKVVREQVECTVRRSRV